MDARLLSALALAAGTLIAAPDAGAQGAGGEYSRTVAAPAPTWKLTPSAAPRAARMQYGAPTVRRLYDLQRANATRQRKATQIGIARRADVEATRPALPALRWVAVRGGHVARIEVASPDALAVRAGLRFERLDDRVELRVGGSDAPARPVAVVPAADARRLLDAQGLYWTPATDGETQVIELFRPAGVPATAVRLQAPMASHLLANSRNDFKIVEKIGESGTCNVDTACRVNTLGPRFVDAKNAVAHMVYVRGGSTYICTGTLLADTVGATQVPYFWSANHCFTDNSNVKPVAGQMQAVANSLTTYWRYEATACGSGVSTPRISLTSGATYLYSDHVTDAMLLRLNNPAPAGAYFAGWSAAPLPAGTAVHAIHHPAGDAKKVSLGQALSSDASEHTVGWTSGTTEGGSSGSGLFVIGRRGEWELRGGLYGGSASCANSGSLATAANRDYYSRLDVVFPAIAQYLASEAVEERGSAPLLPPADPAAQGDAPSAVRGQTDPSATGETGPRREGPARTSRPLRQVR